MNTESISLIREELALAGFSCEDEQRLKKLEARRIRSDTQLPEVEFLFRLQNRPCFARGELVGSRARPRAARPSSAAS